MYVPSIRCRWEGERLGEKIGQKSVSNEMQNFKPERVERILSAQNDQPKNPYCRINGMDEYTIQP